MRILFGVLLISIFSLGGCANFNAKPALPAKGQALSVLMMEEMPGMNEYPLGSYPVPDSQVVITKLREVSRGEGAFGAFGALSAHSSGQKESQVLIAGHEKSLGIMFTPVLQSALMQTLKTSYPTKNWVMAVSDSAKPRLELMPMVYFSPNADGKAFLQVFIKAEYFDASGSGVWSSRYIYRHPQSHPISGPDSWTADNGALYHKIAEEGFARTAAVMIKDSARAESGWQPRRARVRAIFLAGFGEVEINGEILEQTADTVVFNSEGGGIFHGINILTRNEVTILPVKEK